MDIGRNVTVIRLGTGKLVIHSTAKFDEHDIAAVNALGEPGWLVEGMVDHDTYSSAGRNAFPEIPFYAPPTFQGSIGFNTKSLDSPPEEWSPELEVIPILGAPKMAEWVFFHHPSGTLIVCDLLFHFPEFENLWAKILMTPALGFNPAPGFSKRLKMAIKDKAAFSGSLEKVLELPIKRIVPGHGDVLETNAMERARETFGRAGLL